MQIQLDKVGKKFTGREWILKDIDCVFEKGQSYAITGNNGSGKSTLIQIVSGMMPMSRGSVKYMMDAGEMPSEDVFREISFAAPYLDLIEEFSLSEMLDFHFKFKKPYKGISRNELIKVMYLEKSIDKKVQDFSSGMKQRLKLGLAFYSDVGITLLDEPTSNLDKFGMDWYQEHIRKVKNDRILIIASNQSSEYEFCNCVYHIEQSKMSIV